MAVGELVLGRLGTPGGRDKGMAVKETWSANKS